MSVCEYWIGSVPRIGCKLGGILKMNITLEATIRRVEALPEKWRKETNYYIRDIGRRDCADELSSALKGETEK
jgi:hypothetical protein